MQTYFVNRPGIASDAAELSAALNRLRTLEENSPSQPVRWLHSYALRQRNGRFGLGCVFEADSAQALMRHGALAALPATEVLPIAGVSAHRFSPTLVYQVRRRSLWPNLAHLAKSLVRARHIADEEMAQSVSWLRSYAVHEDDGTLGTVCLYQSVSAEALHEHAVRAGMPADEIVQVIGRIVFRDEPEEQTPDAAVPPTALIRQE